MIRINLLPVKAARRRETGRMQLVLAAGALALTFAGVLLFHTHEQSTNDDLRAENARIEAAVAKLKQEIGDYDLVKAQREDLLRQKQAIEKLQNARSGPVYLLREMSDILSPGKGPTFNKEQYDEQVRRDPNAGINANWEPKRAWILTYEEKDHAVKIHGGAKSDEDVAEFLKRLKLSAFFSDVFWQQTQPHVEDKLNVSYVTFDVTARVNY